MLSLNWTRRRVLLGGAATISAGAAASLSRTTPTKHILVIGAMPPGTSWYVFAATFAQMLEHEMPDTDVEIFARGGGIGNPTLVERGKAQIALSQVATAVWAWNGQTSAYKGVQHRRLRALVGNLNSVWVTAVVREDYVRRARRWSLDQILTARPAPRIIMKPPGSTVPVVVDKILGFYGLDRESIRANGGSVLQVSVNQIPEMLSDARADIYFETAIKSHPALTEASTLTPIRFLDFPPPLLTHLANYGMKPRPLPAWFKGQNGPTAAVDCGTVLIARDDLPDKGAYLITKTICEKRDRMVAAHKAWADFQPALGGRIESTGIPLHGGAGQYFRERGWL